MSSAELFLLEFYIIKIKFNTKVLPIPKFNAIKLHISCDPFLDINIAPEDFSFEKDVNAVNNEMKIELGKTYLFPYYLSDLEHTLDRNPLIIDLLVSNKVEGSCKFIWTKDFKNMVHTFETMGVVKSVSVEGNFEILNSSGQSVGFFHMSIKMSCLGEVTETYINMQHRDTIFINAKTLQHVKCEKYDFNNDLIPAISVVYNPIITERPPSETKLSWTQVFMPSTHFDAKSMAMPLSEVEDKRSKTTDVGRPSTVSMKTRPPENKFFDFINLMSADIDTKPDETVVNISFDQKKKLLSGPDQTTKKIKYQDRGSLLSVGESLTSEVITNKLCTNCDCEGLRKFHEHELGPRYRPSGLGEFYEICEPSTTYGMYHVFENLSRYGPQNFYRRPKNPYQKYYGGASKFHGPERIKDKELCYCTPLPDKALYGYELCCCCKHAMKRLRGGGEMECRRKLCEYCKHFEEEYTDIRYPLRLRGGGIIEKSDEKIISQIKPWDPIINDIMKKLLDQISM